MFTIQSSMNFLTNVEINCQYLYHLIGFFDIKALKRTFQDTIRLIS